MAVAAGHFADPLVLLWQSDHSEDESVLGGLHLAGGEVVDVVGVDCLVDAGGLSRGAFVAQFYLFSVYGHSLYPVLAVRLDDNRFVQRAILFVQPTHIQSIRSRHDRIRLCHM